jgi:hypothetical protein
MPWGCHDRTYFSLSFLLLPVLTSQILAAVSADCAIADPKAIRVKLKRSGASVENIYFFNADAILALSPRSSRKKQEKRS